jgi:predicted enzyme related to lactoylglutathione lyase
MALWTLDFDRPVRVANRLQAHGHHVPRPFTAVPEEEQIDEECSRAMVVPDEIGQQKIDHPGVEGDAPHTDQYYSYYPYAATRGRDMIPPASPRRKPMITHVKFVGIPTRDQARALQFYTEKLGFEISTNQPFNDKQRWIELRIANSQTRVVLFTPEGHEDRIGTFFNGSLACDDVEATYRQLRQRGVEFTSEPQKQPWGTFAIFKDPDGNQFVLGSS